MNSDLRKFPRISLANTAAIESSGASFTAELEDLTVEGASFSIDEPASPGSKFTLKFKGSADIEPAELSAEAVRCDEKADGKHLIAVKFLNADDQYLMDILRLIHSGKPA